MSTKRERERIRSEVAKSNAGRRRRFSSELRATIERYATRRHDDGESMVKIASELGVSESTIVRALSGSKELVPMRVVAAPAARQNQSTEDDTIVVTTPNGLVVEGLSIAGLAALIRGLS